MDVSEHRTLLSLRTTVHLDVGDAPAVRIFIRPGGYGRNDRQASLAVEHDSTYLYLGGTPEELRAWAVQIAALADELADDADLAAGTGTEVEEVAF